MVAMRQVGSKIRICPMRGNKFDNPATTSNPMQFAHHGHRLSDVLNYMSPNDFVELVVSKRIWKIVQVMDKISGRTGVHIHSNCAHNLVCATSNVQYATYGRFVIDHRP